MKEEVSLINNSKIPLSFSIIRLDNVFRHIHSSPQILLVLEGECDLYINDESFHMKKNDMVIINNNVFHHIFSKKQCTIVSALLDLKGFGLSSEEIISLSFELNTVKNKNNPRYDQIRYLIYSLIKYNTMENFNSIYTNRAISFSFFAQLINDFGVMKPSNENTKLIVKIEGYMNDHYKENLTLNQIAKEFNYSVAYLSRLFKNQIGKNFKDLYDTLRVNHSLNDLLQTNNNIEEIAVLNGFENARSYVRAFNSIHECNPSVYRKKYVINMSDSTLIDHKLLKKNALDQILAQYDSFGHSKSNTSRDVVRNFEIVANVNAKNVEFKLSNRGSDIIEVKGVFDLFNEDTYVCLQRAKKDMGFKYVLVPNILAEKAYILRKNDENVWSLNFVLFESVLNKIYQLNALPYLMLEYDKDLLTFKEYYTIVLQIYDYLKLNFKDKLKGMMLCFSNYRKSFSDSHGVITKEFFELYLSLYRDIRANFSEIKLGSPLFYKEDIMKSNDFFNFLEIAKKQELTFDFIPIRYTIRDHNNAFLTKDKNEFAHFIDYLKEHNAFFENKICFQGVNFTNNLSLLNDSLYASCFLIKNYMDNLDKIIGYSKRTFIDQTMLSAYDRNPYYGGSGMLTYNGMKKATYNAYVFLSKLEKNVVSKNVHYLVTAKDKRIVILVNNYNHYSDLYAEQEYFEINNLNRYLCFPKSTQINFHFNISNIDAVSCDIKVSNIGEDSGSSYDKWVKMGAKKSLNAEEVESLINLSEIEYVYQKKYVKDNKLELNISVMPLESKLIEITYE